MRGYIRLLLTNGVSSWRGGSCWRSILTGEALSLSTLQAAWWLTHGQPGLSCTTQSPVQTKMAWLYYTTGQVANRQSNVVVFHNLKNSDILRTFNSKLDYGEYGCSIFRAFISTYFHISKIFSILKYKIFSVQHSKVSHPSITLRLWREII